MNENVFARILYRETAGCGDDDEGFQKDGVAVTLTHWRPTDADPDLLASHYLCTWTVIKDHELAFQDELVEIGGGYCIPDAQAIRKAIARFDRMVEVYMPKEPETDDTPEPTPILLERQKAGPNDLGDLNRLRKAMYDTVQGQLPMEVVPAEIDPDGPSEAELEARAKESADHDRHRLDMNSEGKGQ